MSSSPQSTASGESEQAVVEESINAGGGTAVARSSNEVLLSFARRIRHGESGALPVVIGLVIIVVIFQVENSNFLTPGNITNLLIQSVTYVLLGMAEVFVLLLAEIDLSIGYIGAIGGIVAVAATASDGANWPWWAGCILGLVVSTAICAFWGLLIAYLKIPSFVVTLAGLLGGEGALIYLANREGGKTGGGVVDITNQTMNDFVYGTIPPVAGWIALAVVVVLFAAVVLMRDIRLRASGLEAPPRGIAYAKIAVVAAAGVALVAICNNNRGRGVVVVEGVPWCIPIVLAVLVIWSFLLGRTKTGRYIYAMGGNREAARRAGVNLNRILILAFTLGGLTAGVAGILYASQLGSISSNVNGGELVLYAVAAAVIGGTSLTGGRGKMVHALLGGLIVAAIYNGMGLIGLTADAQDVVIALVLLAAVTVDAVSRRGRGAT